MLIYREDYREEDVILYDIEASTEEEIPNARGAAYLTFGMEIEQPDFLISQELRRRYEWSYDGSGPLETALPPSKHPLVQIHRFVQTVIETKSEWSWVNEYSHFGRFHGCGSHIHFRPREDIPVIKENWIEAWTTIYNTFVEVTPFLLPCLCWGNPETIGTYNQVFRLEVFRWAYLVRERFNPRSMERALDYLEHHTAHPYDSVALNRKSFEKPVTIEIRLNEAHPAYAAYFGIVMNRIVKACVDRGFLSPKLREDLREDFFDQLERGISYAMDDRTAIYDVLKRVDTYGKGIVFERTIPGLKKEYRNALEVFDDIVKKYTPDTRHSLRVAYLLLTRSSPLKNAYSIWHCIGPKRGQFSWSDPPVSDWKMFSYVYKKMEEY